MYLTVDGGGSKITAILFDESLHELGRGYSGGVNSTQNDAASILTHVQECLDQALSPCRPEDIIEEAFVVFVGSKPLFEQELRRRISVKKITFFPEAKAGLIAGSGKYEGLLAISGTGSDAFYMKDGCNGIVGGWGIVLGDQGSGTWIGLKALRMAVRLLDGWGPASFPEELPLFVHKILQHFDAEDNPRKMITAVHSAPAPFPVIARLVPVIAEAAREGDPFALGLFQDAGSVLARQMLSLIERKHLQETEITLCGGAWKAHAAMFQSFQDTIKATRPAIEVHYPWFEHVMAGPMELMLRSGLAPEEARKKVAEAFPSEQYAEPVMN